MNVLTFIKGIFSTPKAVDTGLKIAEDATNGIIRGVDAIWYTKEEQAKDNKEVLKLAQDTILAIWETFKDDNSARSVARRHMATALVYTYIGVVLIGIFLVSRTGLPPLDMLKALMEWLEAIYFVYFIGGVMATYFVPYQIGKAVDTAKGKKERKNG